MKTQVLVAASIAASGVAAFRDTSPFFLLSTSRLTDTTSTFRPEDNVATARTIEEHLLAALHGCPSDSYIVVNQPGVSSSDFKRMDKAVHLGRRLTGQVEEIQTRQSVSSVIGDLGATNLVPDLSRHCSAEVVVLQHNKLPSTDAKTPQIITIDLPQLSPTSPKREDDLNTNDAYLNSVIGALPTKKYTVIFRTTPPDQQQSSNGNQQPMYLVDEPYAESLQANHFKRDMEAYPRAANGSNLNANVALFEKYQFLSSGIFMGGTVALLLLTILYIGISAVAGLEVSYYAFSKEFNTANQQQKK